MAHVMESREGTIVATNERVAARPPRLTTTLSALLAAFHEGVGPRGGRARGGHRTGLLESGQLTWRGEAAHRPP